MATTYTLLALRREVAKRLGDYYGDPTGAASTSTLTTGGTNNVIDTKRPESNDFFNGGYFVSETEATPQYARIADYASSTKTFAFASALGSSLSVGAKYCVYKNFSPDEYALAVNAAIDAVKHLVKTDATPDVSLTLTYNQTEYSVPAGFSTIWRVSVEKAGVTGVYDVLNPDDWDVIFGSAKLLLGDRIVGSTWLPLSGSTTRRIKLEGAAFVTGGLAAEADTTTVPARLIVPYACQYLLRQTVNGGSAQAARIAAIKDYELEMSAQLNNLPPVVHYENEKRVRAV